MEQQEINNQSMLQVGTILRGTYRIDSYLSSGGFGNTYVATNIEFDERVAIKEFFMKGVTQRDDNQTTVSVSNVENKNSFLEQKEKFKKEARRIRQLKNEHIVSVHDMFDENGTAYYVMDYVDGENLAQYMKRTGKPMSEKRVREILPQILDALKAVHDAGMWHLDLKPANIMLDKSGNVKLIDFGASKQLNAQKGGATTSTAITYTNGYAPREQMEQNYDKFGPWTDIYALGATLYNLLTNKRPPMPSDIDDDETDDKHEALPFPEKVSEPTKQLVLHMMRTNRLERPQSVGTIVVGKQQKSESTSKTSRTLIEKKEDNIPSKKTLKNEKTKKDNTEKQVDSLTHQDDEETVIAPVIEEVPKPNNLTPEVSLPEEDSSYIDDMEETWKDKLKEKLTDLKNIGVIFLVLAGVGLIRQLITCEGIPELFANSEKEFAELLEKSDNPNLTEEEQTQMMTRMQVLANKGYGPAVFFMGSSIIDIDSVKAYEYIHHATELLSKEAEDGDPYAQYFLGNCYYSALGVNQDVDKAFVLYEKASEKNIPLAILGLAICYINGDGVQADYDKGMELLNKAAKSNVPHILETTAEIYEQCENDSSMAYNYYQKAADLGNTKAMLNIGYYFEKGIVVKKNTQRALEWYTKAKEDKGLNVKASAFFRIGYIFLTGDDSEIEMDVDRATKNFEKSLMYNDSPEVHWWLATCYIFKNELTKAYKQLKKSAEGGFPIAQSDLADFYQNGIGVEKDKELAKFWRKKAIENGYKE